MTEPQQPRRYRIDRATAEQMRREMQEQQQRIQRDLMARVDERERRQAEYGPPEFQDGERVWIERTYPAIVADVTFDMEDGEYRYTVIAELSGRMLGADTGEMPDETAHRMTENAAHFAAPSESRT
jgi:hypothetical protein